jgi:hypothetical protein
MISVMSVCPDKAISWLVTTEIGLVALMFAGTGMRDPVTMTSCSVASGAAVVAGACCAMAGISMAAMHTDTDKMIVIRFTSELTLIDFCIPILISLNFCYMWQRVCNCEDSRCVVATKNTNERRSNWVDDSRLPTDENENGMKAADSVMKATGSVMKVRMYLSASYINARVVANRAIAKRVRRWECLGANRPR